MLRALPLLASIVLIFGAALAREEAASPVETVSVGQTLGMLLFLLVAALIVLSVVAKVLIAIGIVPMRPETRLHRIIHSLARVVGTIQTKKARKGASAADGRGGGGSFGGGGASGEF